MDKKQFTSATYIGSVFNISCNWYCNKRCNPDAAIRHYINDLDPYSSPDQALLLFTPVLSIITGLLLIMKVMREQADETIERTYKNKYLNYLNTFLATKSRSPFWILVLLFPVFFITTLILVLLGQDINALVKVFTDTATWKLSQQVHPPKLDHHGHYLCTVAAKGDPKIVKPLQIGRRNGDAIIVNRQLQIANAFEEMVCDFSPKLHQLIRGSYDRYGYNLSVKINNTRLSDITYILMKPLEWFFLICLYLFCVKPEVKISKQYCDADTSIQH